MSAPWPCSPSTPLGREPATGTLVSDVLVHEAPASPPRLLEQVRLRLRARHASPRTEDCSTRWTRRFIRFHGHRHPSTMAAPEIVAFLSMLASDGRVSASTQNQALCALLLQPVRLPIVLSRVEVTALLGELRADTWLMAALLYGAGLRLLECCTLRVKDLDLARGEIRIRDGKGRKDRVTVLPTSLIRPLEAQLERVRRLHATALERCRALLGAVPPAPIKAESAQAAVLRLTGVDIQRCPACGDGRLHVIRQLMPLRGRSPPPIHDTS